LAQGYRENRYQLKGNGIHDSWKEIVRTANTQKLVTTMGTNLYGKTIKTVKCTTPTEKLKAIMAALNLPPYIKRKKSVVHKLKPEKKQTHYPRAFLTG
jgi:hypothetical protein